MLDFQGFIKEESTRCESKQGYNNVFSSALQCQGMDSCFCPWKISGNIRKRCLLRYEYAKYFVLVGKWRSTNLLKFPCRFGVTPYKVLLRGELQIFGHGEVTCEHPHFHSGAPIAPLGSTHSSTPHIWVCPCRSFLSVKQSVWEHSRVLVRIKRRFDK